MLLLLALALFALLLYRLDAFSEIRDRRALLSFETRLLQTSEEEGWEEHMERVTERGPKSYRRPFLRLR